LFVRIEPVRELIKEMIISLIINILAIVLTSLRTSPLFFRIAAIVLLYAAALYVIYLSVVYIQSIGSGIGFFSRLFHDLLSAQYCAVDEIVPSTLFFSSMPLLKPGRRLSKAEQSKFTLSDELKQILIGLILGDLHIPKKTLNSNPYLQFAQGTVHEQYLMHLYDLFSSYCKSAPKIINELPDKRTGKIYTKVRFITRSLPCFNELYELFYPEGNKIIPLNIGDLLTHLSLAYWICDDGCFCKTQRVVYLSTNSFSFVELNHLINVLTNKYNLKCTINKNNGGLRIRISSKSLPVLQALLAPVMPPMMLHKIGL
jgi:hypothetical protein